MPYGIIERLNRRNLGKRNGNHFKCRSKGKKEKLVTHGVQGGCNTEEASLTRSGNCDRPAWEKTEAGQCAGRKEDEKGNDAMRGLQVMRSKGRNVSNQLAKSEEVWCEKDGIRNCQRKFRDHSKSSK